MAEYKISLGVELDTSVDTSDIQDQISAASKNIKPIELKIDADTTELTNTIKEALNSMSKGTKDALKLNTSEIKKSLDGLSSIVDKIKQSLGTLDNASGMKDLLSSINQIATALGKVENESDSLVKSLSALSKKDFSFNFGFDFGKKNNNMIAYGRAARKQVIPELEAQIKEIENLFGGKQTAISKLIKQGKNVGFDVFTDFNDFSSDSAIKKMEAMEKYINSLKKLSTIENVNLDGFNEIHKDASALINDIVGLDNAADKADDVPEKLKRIFGSGVNGEKLSAQLDDIATNLKEIKTVIEGLSQNNAIDGLTQSFNKLSDTLDKLMTNAKLVQDVLGSVGSGVNVGAGDRLEKQAQQAQQSAKEIQQATKQITNAYNKIAKDTSLVRDDANFQKTFESSNQAAQEAQRHFQKLLADEKAVVSVTEQFDDNNALQSFTVNIKRASGEVETLRYAMDKLDDVLGDEGRFIYQGGSASDSKVEKQLESRIKKANDLQIKLDKIKSNYGDMGAAKPIKDINHIESLDEQYKKVEKAINDVKNADDTTFSSMVSNAEKEKAALENMVREYKNAENVATSLRSKNISTVGATYSSDLDVLISKMRKDGVYTSGFEKGAENLRSMLSNAVTNKDKNGLVGFLNGLDKLEAGYKRASASVKEFNQAQKVGINVSGLESKIADIQRISPEIDRFEAEINGVKVSVKSLLSDLGKVKTQGDFSVVNARFKAFADAAKAAGIAITETAQKAKSINDIKIKLELGTFENQVHQLHDSLDQLTDVDSSLYRLRASINQVDDAYDAMTKATDDESLIQAQKRFAAAVEKTNNELKIQAREQRAANNAAKLVDSKAALKTDMLNWLKKNSKATKEYKAEIDKLIASLDKLDQAGVNGVRRRFSNIDKDAELKGLKGLNFFDSMKNKIKEYSVYFGAAEMFMYAEQGLRSMFEQVKLIDSAMTELKKVTNETDAAYSNFLKNAATRSREIGTTIDGLVSSTADFARLGYGFKDAQGLAEVANIYAVVGDEIEGVEGATESLISTMAAFKDEMNGMSNTDFAMSIIDKFNEIGNNFAISSGGIGEALERSASSLMSANNTIDESIALITAANTVVQDPEQVGTAFKTISMRIRGAKTELEEAGLETEGMVESTSKLRSEILALTGVDIMDGANQFKSTYKIMDELAVKWKDLTDIQQATVTELIAGKVFCQSVQKCA